jgi:HPt (histidine-containing phosphotransfer) domain-containing protein
MLYDLSMLRKLTNNDLTFIVDMLQTFKRTAPPALDRMKDYVSRNKFEEVGREAHKLIPGVSFLGAKKLQDVLVIIEESAKKTDNHSKIPALVLEATDDTNELISCFENDFNLKETDKNE